jgi:aspartate kinase
MAAASTTSSSSTLLWVVLKYGGTSVSTSDTWKAIYQRIEEILTKEQANVWVTVSAVSQVTNKLIQSLQPDEEGRKAFEWVLERHLQLQKDLQLTNDEFEPVLNLLKDLGRILEGVQLTGEVTPRLRARVLALGELCSSLAGRAFLAREFKNNINVQVCRVDARKLLVATSRPIEHDETRFLEADVMPRTAPQEALEEMKKELGNNFSETKKNVVITQGFIASTIVSGVSHTCLLGRGGSDTSGALFAAFLGAKRCEIWTDVYGLFTCDPRLVPEARLIREMSYREAQELAAMGAKVLHPRCLGPAQWANVPVEVRNTMDPEGSNRGILTRVCSNPDEGAAAGKPRVVAVTKRTDQILLTVQNFDMWGTSGFLSKVFSPFGQMGIGVDLIATSEYSVSMTLDNVPGGFRGQVLARLVAELKALVPRGSVTVEERCVIVSIVGRRLRHALPNLAKAFRCMQGYDVRMVTESAEDLNLSFVVADPNAVPGYIDALVARLHRALFNTSTEQTPAEAEESSDEVDESLGASWDELRAKNGPTPRPFPTTQPPVKKRPLTTASPMSSLKSPTNAQGHVAFFKTENDAIIHTGDGYWSSEHGLDEIDRMWQLSSPQSGFVVVDCSILKTLKATASSIKPRFRLSDLGRANKRVILALVEAGYGLECETLECVKECFNALSVFKHKTEVVVAFAPKHCASKEEYALAASFGCQEIVLDDTDAAAECPECDIYSVTEGKYELKQRGRKVRDSSRAGRWDELFHLQEPIKERVVFGGAQVSPAVAFASIVTRVSADGKSFRVQSGPNPFQIEAFGLKVLNCTRRGDTFKQGDVVIFVEDTAKSAGKFTGIAWWLNV